LYLVALLTKNKPDNPPSNPTWNKIQLESINRYQN
jgi:hypothetical protein